MLIAIDASRANKENKTGVEWYSYHIINELKKIIPDTDRVILYTNEKLTGQLGNLPANWREKDLFWPPKYLWTQIRLWWELFLNPPDVLFVPAHTISFLPLRKKVKVAVNVHDVGFRRFPQLYKPIQVLYHDLTMKRIKRRADSIITISDFSQREIIDLYGVKPEKLAVVHLAYDRSAYCQVGDNDDTALSGYKIKKPYVLYVGRLEKKKNIGNLVSAFVLAKMKHPDLKLVLSGIVGNDFSAIKDIISKNKLEKEIIITGYVPEKDLPALFRQAEAFMFVTLYEGFGLPIIQAMACGTPVIISNQDPHREVAGEAAALADSKDIKDIYSQLDKILSDPQYKAGLIEAGLKRARNFSWRQSAEQVFEIIKKIAE